MATVTDVLETLLKLVGGPQYAAAMTQAANQTKKLSDTQKKLKDTHKELEQATSGLTDQLKELGKAAAIAASIRAVFTAFSEDQQAIFRTSILLKNLGSDIPISEVKAFGAAMAEVAAVDDEDVVRLYGSLARFGLIDKQIRELTPAIINFSKAEGIDLQQATQAVSTALAGQTRTLRHYGIILKDTGSIAGNLAEIQRQLNEQYTGTAAAHLDTLQGAWQRLLVTWGNFKSAIGGGFEQFFVTIIGWADALLKRLIKIQEWNEGVKDAWYGPQMSPNRDPAAGVGGKKPIKGDPEQTRLLGNIDANTAKMDPLIRQVLGGKGEIARGAFAWRDARMSFGI